MAQQIDKKEKTRYLKPPIFAVAPMMDGQTGAESENKNNPIGSIAWTKYQNFSNRIRAKQGSQRWS